MKGTLRVVKGVYGQVELPSSARFCRSPYCCRVQPCWRAPASVSRGAVEDVVGEARMQQLRTAAAWLLAASAYLIVGCHSASPGSPRSPEQSRSSIDTSTRNPSASIPSSAAAPSPPSSASSSASSSNNLSRQEILLGSSWVLQQVQIGSNLPRPARPGKTILSIQGDTLKSYDTCGQNVQARVTVDGSSMKLAGASSSSIGAPPPGALCGDTEAVALWNTGGTFRWEVDRSHLIVKIGATTLTYGVG